MTQKKQQPKYRQSETVVIKRVADQLRSIQSPKGRPGGCQEAQKEL